jgi:hypothetical protein
MGPLNRPKNSHTLNRAAEAHAKNAAKAALLRDEARARPMPHGVPKTSH